MNKKYTAVGVNKSLQRELANQGLDIENTTNQLPKSVTTNTILATKATIMDLVFLDDTSTLAKTKIIQNIQQAIEKVESLNISNKQNSNYLSQTEESIQKITNDLTTIQEELKAKNKIYANEEKFFEETDTMTKDIIKKLKLSIEIYEAIHTLSKKIYELYTELPKLEEWIKKETNQERKKELTIILQIKNITKEIFERLRMYGREITYTTYSTEQTQEIKETIQEAKRLAQIAKI